jgi:hypothetical protein
MRHGFKTLAVIASLGLLFSACALLSSCAVSGTIEDASSSESQFDKALIYDGERKQVQAPLPGVETHRIFHQGATGFTPISAVRSSAMARVVEYCKLKGQVPYLVEETTAKPPYILGNWPRIELVFSCVESSQAEGQNNGASDKYDELSKLKHLLDEGAITQEEYEQEKKKILAR